MSDYTFPSQVNYTEQAGSLPKDVKCLNICTQPSNGQTFGPSSQIYLDLVSGRGYLDPQSVYISYTLTLTNAAATQMIGTPVYTPFNRVAVDIGSKQIDQISNYNIVMNTLTNCNMSVSEKYGLQSAYGYNDNTSVPTLEQLDGRLCAINEIISLSAPLLTVISASEKLWPLWSMGGVRLTLTLEAISNMFNSTVTVPTNYSITNVQLRYKVIDFGNEDFLRFDNGDVVKIEASCMEEAEDWLLKNDDRLIIDHETLQLTGILSSFNTGGVVVKSYSSTDLIGRIIDTQIFATINLNNFQLRPNKNSCFKIASFYYDFLIILYDAAALSLPNIFSRRIRSC